MRNKLLFGMMFVGFILIGSLAHAAILAPTTDGSILDGFVYNVGLVDKDGFPDQLDDAQSVEVFNRFLVEKRGVMEFSLAHFSDLVDSAYLKIHKIDALITSDLNMELYGFMGNGILDNSDYSNGTLIHSFVYKGESEPVINVTSFIQDMQLSHSDYAGFNLRMLDGPPFLPGNSYIAFGSQENLPAAQLFLNQNPPVVPEPASALLFMAGLTGVYFRRKFVR